jgi:hypothetical protein
MRRSSVLSHPLQSVFPASNVPTINYFIQALVAIDINYKTFYSPNGTPRFKIEHQNQQFLILDIHSCLR